MYTKEQVAKIYSDILNDMALRYDGCNRDLQEAARNVLESAEKNGFKDPELDVEGALVELKIKW
ncbi:hypothetical protein [Chitinophaga tropicalis]|nr:hypothetical protein [Chitinophaga tropicalis]